MMSHSEELDEINRSTVAQLSVTTPMSFISPRLIMQALSYLTSSQEGEHSATRYFERKGPRSSNLYYSILLHFFYFISRYY